MWAARCESLSDICARNCAMEFPERLDVKLGNPISGSEKSFRRGFPPIEICQSTSQVPFLFSVVVGPQFLRTSCELQDLTKFLSACTFMYLQDKVPWVVATGLGSLEFQDLDRHGGPDNVEYLEKFTYLLLSFSKFPAFSCRGFLFFRQRVL